MNIHEHQSKELLRSFGVNVPEGRAVWSYTEAKETFFALGGKRCIIKAQVHAGGRMKAGGIQFADSANEAERITKELIGKTIFPNQFETVGKKIKKVLIERAYVIEEEYYISFMIDRESSRVVLIASEAGGIDIEEFALQKPQLIIKEIIDPTVGLLPFQARKIAYEIKIPNSLVPKVQETLMGLYRTFIVNDCSLLEINPLVITSEKEVLALDAKINFDNNAMYRQERIFRLRDFDEENKKEIEAMEHGLSYISLYGNIGCMVNGAGLAMATMDIIKEYGGEPANFLDVGGSATSKKVAEAFKLIVSDKDIKGIFVNIFGGIMMCDVIATGIVEAAKQVELNCPVVVRLEGTNVNEGKEILKESNLQIISAVSMEDGAKKIIQLIQ